MAKTPNYNLKKVEYTEIADIPGHFNANFDKIDEELKERDTRVGPLASLLTTTKTSIVNAINSLKGEVDEHKADNMPHLMLVDNKVYKYGFKQENGFVKFLYEEVM